MYGENVSLGDYNSGFFGSDTENPLELFKAMQAGQITGRDTTNLTLSGEPLKLESLDRTMKRLTSRMKDIRLFNEMPKNPAYNTVEEYAQLNSYGTQRGGFYNEGELSDVEDSQYIRRASFTKYLQITGEVTLQAQMVRSMVDMMRQEVDNKVMWINQRANEFMTKGNSALVPQEWDGLYALHASIGTNQLYATLEDYYTSTVVIDLRGASLKQQDVEKGAVVVDGNYGNVSHLFAPTVVLSTLSQDYFQDQRIMLNSNSPTSYNGKIGTVAKAIDTTIGEVQLAPDKFMQVNSDREVRTLASAATSDKAPNAPVSSAIAVNVDATSKFRSGETGVSYYAVASKNRYGQSALTQIGTSATIAVGSSVDLTFNSGGGSNAATAYVVYRTEITTASVTSTTKFYPIFEVSVSEKAAGYDGAAAGSVRDRGRILPNTETAFLTEMVEEVLAFKQLAPISKLDLAILSMSRRFITFLFGMPQLYAPKKMVKFINCARTLTA